MNLACVIDERIPFPCLLRTIMRLCLRELLVGAWRPPMVLLLMFWGTVVLMLWSCEGRRSPLLLLSILWLIFVPIAVRFPTDMDPEPPLQPPPPLIPPQRLPLPISEFVRLDWRLSYRLSGR